jgi:hypothetical protein
MSFRKVEDNKKALLWFPERHYFRAYVFVPYKDAVNQNARPVNNVKFPKPLVFTKRNPEVLMRSVILWGDRGLKANNTLLYIFKIKESFIPSSVHPMIICSTSE